MKLKIWCFKLITLENLKIRIKFMYMVPPEN